MFAPMPDIHRLGGLHRLHRFHRVRRSGPSVGHLLIAGLAVFALVKLMSAATRPRRSRLSALTIGLMVLAVGAFVMSLRRSARRYSW